MEAAIISVLFMVIAGSYTYRSVCIVDEGKICLVERLGRYHKTLKPGINIVLPLLDQIVLTKSAREQELKISPQPCTTSDKVSLSVGGVVYWMIKDLEKAYYTIQDIDTSLQTSVRTQIQTQIGQRELDKVIGAQDDVNREILDGITADTAAWGIQVLRVRLGEVTIPDSVRQSMEKQQAAEIEKRAMISLSEGEKAAEIKKAEAEAESRTVLAESQRKVRLAEAEALAQAIELVALAISKHPNGNEAIRYLLAQNYIEMGKNIGTSPSAKVLFMDPSTVPGMIQSLLNMTQSTAAEMDAKQPFGASSNLPPLANAFWTNSPQDLGGENIDVTNNPLN